MGLSQKIIFEYERESLISLLNEIEYKELDIHEFAKSNDRFLIRLAIEPYGLYIHRTGEYFYELGLLLERIGEISESLTLEDF